MIKTCRGCGVTLQDNNVLLEGYTNDMRNDYCRRCFKMNNYGEYEFVTKSNSEYIKILERIGKSKSLVLYIVDVLSIPENVLNIKKYLKNNKIILVINKKDVLDSSVSDEKLYSFFDDVRDNFVDIIITSASKNYNLEKLIKTIKINKTNEKVYIVGNTNAGKSTLINSLTSKYLINSSQITISSMPSTTLNEIIIPFKDFSLIDTPGLVDDGNILNFLDVSTIKKLSLKKEIKPITFQLKKGQAIIIEDFLRVDYVEGDKNSFTLFVPNNLNIKRINGKRHNYLKDLSMRQMNLKFREDIVVNGLGFIKVIFEGQVNIYCNNSVDIFTRKSLI